MADPIGLDGATSATMNLYGYASQNPIRFIDPLGLFNIQSYVDWMLNNAHETSQHQCAAYVRRGLEAGGADTTGHPVNASEYGPTLENNDFSPVPQANYTPQPGDTAVFQPYDGGNPAGHIQTFTGSGWTSDFNQPNFFPSSGYKNSSYQVFRPSANTP